jgi:hypothetical protein
MKQPLKFKALLVALFIVFVVSISFNGFYAELLGVSSDSVKAQMPDALVNEKISIFKKTENTVIFKKFVSEKQKSFQTVKTETEAISSNLFLPDNYISDSNLFANLYIAKTKHRKFLNAKLFLFGNGHNDKKISVLGVCRTCFVMGVYLSNYTPDKPLAV